MKCGKIKNLTIEQIKCQQRTIQDQLIIDLAIIKDMQKKLNKLRLTTCQYQDDFRELDKELYLRTKDIIKIAPKKKRKHSTKKESSKIIDKLVKDLGSEEVKRLLNQINHSKGN